MKIYIYTLLFTFFLYSGEYEIGNGWKVNDKLTISGYFSTEYFFLNQNSKFVFDDMALLAYGHLSSSLSYFVEIESSESYINDFHNSSVSKNFITYVERGYLDYSNSEAIHIRVGKMVTPIGYWNYEPINVLRDTTSSPIYSFSTFPKLLTGLDLYGRLSYLDGAQYHLFMQNNKDLDDTKLNIKSKYFYGLSLEYEIEEDTQVGGSVGRYKIDGSNQVVNFVQADTKYTYNDVDIQSELIYLKNENTSFTQLTGYLQGQYHLNMKHSLVGRYEYIDKDKINMIGILGYSYRPIYPVSFKMEYQMHSDSNADKALMSFSVLF
jgi:hypothetical protein